MESAIDRLIEECVGALREGALSEQALRSAFADVAVEGGGRQDCIGRQDLLYLQCSTVGLDCAILGMRMVIDGEFDDGPDDPEDWPYKSVLGRPQGWLADRQFPRPGPPRRRVEDLRSRARIHPRKVALRHEDSA